ncbi:tRNA glutamyl-Q(34) synthetase GluQRS [Roseibium aquae]|uniref:tRNA glutamyl-Q(34) synthetase GluQRS n=1 Tax=Roseibium aquae TaxID=1323746 RepID=A0A916WY68_9HYPH|nr:tRNA glutamyl-Q(34) synthetase GluQRS [Roseibium aquae]GGB38888.1 tRNA glutamyl-Q(34) synthetase GluQRS [Roseibium aquae]
MSERIFRFAPSPNGHLHLGHALSALLNRQAADRFGGRLLLRLEDIDQTRCTPDLEREMLEDLSWLGITFDGPVWRQSERFAAYGTALDRLQSIGLVYRGYLTRAEIKAHVARLESETGRAWPRDPDGAPHYPGDASVLPPDEINSRWTNAAPFALRLDMKAALDQISGPLVWMEASAEGADLANTRPAPIAADPSIWGDVVLARKDTPTSYHLSVVVDDAAQQITDVVRGRDLYAATSVHRLLQDLLGYPAPVYCHHRLILGPDGTKLSKSAGDTSLRALRAAGMNLSGLMRRIGLA